LYVFLTVYNKDCNLTREGGSIPVTLTIQEATKTNVMLLPIGQSDDGAHAQNEKMSIRNYVNGVSTDRSFFYGVKNKGTSKCCYFEDLVNEVQVTSFSLPYRSWSQISG